MTPEQIIGIKFGTDFCSVGVSVLRYIVTRKQYKNLYGIICNLCLLLACTSNVIGSGLVAYIMLQERKSLDKFGGDTKLAGQEVGTTNNSRVC